MLARLQQFLTLGLLALAIAWMAGFIAAGQAFWAFGGALAILFGYAGFLAVEFVLLACTHRDDAAPRATPRQLMRAWWGEVITAPRVFCWRQPFRSNAEPDHLPAQARGRRGVLLVHGFVCNRGFWNPWMTRLRAAGVPFVAVNLEPVFGSVDDYVAILDAAAQRLNALTGLSPLVVAHSMGGLAVRAWLQQAGPASAAHVITIGTPHRGTWLGRFALTRNGLQMRLGNAWLDTLCRAENTAHGGVNDSASAASCYANFTCFYSHCDNIVFPPSTATLPGADNRHVAATAHVHLAFQDAVFNEVRRRLDTSPAASAGALAPQ
jgi:triacylglycerol lipase